jgi:hypothetical protein
MASRDYASFLSNAQLESETVLQRIVRFLCSEGDGNWSFTSLSAALDIPERRLREAFGTEETLLAAAQQLLPDVLLAAVAQPLRTARTGREAVRSMLEIAVTLRKSRCQLKDHCATVRPPAIERRADEQLNWDWDKSLGYEIQDRLERSVYEGELPESVNVRSMSALALALVNGLVFRAPGEVSEVTLLDSVRLFVDGLGFHVARPPKRPPRRLAPVLQFVR